MAYASCGLHSIRDHELKWECRNPRMQLACRHCIVQLSDVTLARLHSSRLTVRPSYRQLTTLTVRLRICTASPRKSRSVSATMPVSAQVPNVTNIIDFLHLVQRLKKQPRKGWILRDVQNPESIADHMYRMSVLALTMAGSKDVDQARLVKMAIVHDIAEAIVGDITPVCGVSEEEKHRQELSAILEIQKMLGPETAVADEVVALWKEYEEGATDEAKLCKDFDKIEMIMQAYEYEDEQPLDLQEFFDSTAGKWRTSLGQALAEEIVSRRSQAKQ